MRSSASRPSSTGRPTSCWAGWRPRAWTLPPRSLRPRPWATPRPIPAM